MQSRLRSSLLYPAFVLTLAVVIGAGIAWFILPRLANVFSQLNLSLPLPTRVLIFLGNFLGDHGAIAVPLFLAGIAFLIYFCFIFSKTKFIGQSILFHLPIIGRLIKEAELARLGYVFGSLLKAGLPIVEALRSLTEVTGAPVYQKFFLFLHHNIEEGKSFEQSFAAYKSLGRLMPVPIQQMIITAEKSGTLAETFLKIGQFFEVKTENTSRNLVAILEPFLLVIVWLGVLVIALAVILPIYNLIGGLG